MKDQTTFKHQTFMPLSHPFWVPFKKLSFDSNRHVFSYHLLLSLFFFSNFFLFGQILIYSTDVLNLNFPILLFSKQNFLAGHAGLWNPYILSGVSGFSYSNLPILSPDNWPLFLIPEKYFFVAATLVSFIKFWLIGIFSFLLFNEELKSRKWAFFASAIYQFSGHTLWSLFVYDVLSMVLFTTISLYLIWTLSTRKPHLNYVYLTLVLTLNMLSSNIAYTAHAMLVIGLLFLYRFFSQPSLARPASHVYVCFLAFLTSTTISLIRLIPVWIETHSSNRQFVFSPNYLDTSFLALRLFDPEVLGVCYRSSQAIIAGLSDRLRGMHIHESMPHYFGVASALLVLWAIVSPLKGKFNFWTYYVVFALSAILFVEPFDTILKTINPAYHALSLQTFLPVGFCMLAGHAAKYMEDNLETVSLHGKSAQVLAFLIAVILLYIMAVWIGNFREELNLVRILVILAIFAFFSMSLLYRSWPQVFLKICMLLGVILFFCILYLMLLHHHSNSTYLSHLKNMSASLLMLLMTYGFLLITAFGKAELKRYFWACAIPLSLLSFLVTLYPWAEAIRELPDRKGDFILAMLGLLRFILVTAIFLSVYRMNVARQFSRSWLFPLLLSVLLFEQLPASKIHSHIVINPFYRQSSPYPPLHDVFLDTDGQPIKFDHKNYRVNRPNTLLSLPIYEGLYGADNEVLSSMFSVYGIRSYGGHYNVVSSRYEKFIKDLVPDLPRDTVGYGVYTRIKDERFLDLAGVKYDYADQPSKAIKTRPNALSRFMLFQSYEVLENGQSAFEKLRSPDFDPLRTVVLEKDPGSPISGMREANRILQYSERSTDEIELKLQSDLPGILLFNDSYHEGWKAFVNGLEQQIIPANRAFMAIKVPAGASTVVFRFMPRYFTYGLYAASAGGLMLTLITLILYLKREHL